MRRWNQRRNKDIFEFRRVIVRIAANIKRARSCGISDWRAPHCIHVLDIVCSSLRRFELNGQVPVAREHCLKCRARFTADWTRVVFSSVVAHAVQKVNHYTHQFRSRVQRFALCCGSSAFPAESDAEGLAVRRPGDS